MPLRITTWNVNGVRNPFSYSPWRSERTFASMFDILETDIVIFQELKIQRKDITEDMVLIPGWDCFYSVPQQKKGYSGVGIFTRQSKCAPIHAEEGLLGVMKRSGTPTAYCNLPVAESIGGYLSPDQIAYIEALDVDPLELDSEGRCVVVEFPAFVLFGCYFPANSNGLRDNYRYAYITAADMRIRNLVNLGKRVVLTGDLNVSRSMLDTANIEERLRKESMTFDDYASMPNRRIFHQLIEDGEVFGDRDDGRERPVLWDVCRGFHPGRKGMFTHWEQKINARPGNFGSRIDYVLSSIEMKTWFSDSNIQEGLMGSDHCPVYATLKETVSLDGQTVHLADIMNPPGMFVDGKKLREWSTKDMCPLSARHFPEFNARRSIKDMFSQKPRLPGSRSDLPSATPSEVSTSANTQYPGTSQPSGAEAQTLCNSILSPQSTNVTSSLPQSSPERKRAASAPSPSNKIAKKSKASATSTISTKSKGQQSLKGFFQPKIVHPPTSPKFEEAPAIDSAFTSPEKSSQSSNKPSTLSNVSLTANSTALQETAPDEEPFLDPIVTKESWDKLFTKKPPPRCEGHGEPCTLLKTKKPGVNLGRSFWICPRPVGPTGAKERGTEWRCPTFTWASESNRAS